MSNTIWKPVDGFEDKYLVSNTGLVYGIKRNHLLKQQTDHNRYKKVMLSIAQNNIKFLWVHRLVAKAFCDGYFEGAEVNHIDCDGSNNNSSNLEWVTHKENMQHCISSGRHKNPPKNYFNINKRKHLQKLRICAIILNSGWLKEQDAQGN